MLDVNNLLSLMFVWNLSGGQEADA